MANVNFIQGSVANFLALATKDTNTLYFLDNGQLYKGDMLLSNNVVLIPDGSDYPVTGVSNTVYAKASGECAFWNGTSYTLISRSVMTELEALEDRINETVRLALTSKGIDAVGIIQRTVTEVESTDVTSVGTNAFTNCSQLTSVDFPNVTSIGGGVFSGCTSLTSINLPNVTSIGNATFSGCTSLTSINLPNVTSIGNATFSGCTNLTSIDLPNVTSIDGSTVFQGCTSLTSIDLPNVTSIGNATFSGCTNLTSIDLPNVTSIGVSAFSGCTSLIKIIIGTDISGICALNTKVFNNTPIASGSGYIYVSDDKVDTYKSASNWSTYSAQIKSVNELS